MNNKGFALTETLVVLVFLVSIFTFIYVSIIPLLGKYENAINTEKDIEIVYKLYHVRKLIMSDANRANITTNEVSRIECNSLDKEAFCENLMEQLELKTSTSDDYVIIYANSLTDTNIEAIRTINNEIADYANKYKNEISGKVLFLLDTKKHTICHLYCDIAPICKRATVLHTETCTQSSNYCYRDGYYVGGSKNTTTITYGNLGTQGNGIVTGDAFDCDVNGDNIYDPTTERFYYISDRWTPSNSMAGNTFDSNYAVLIYSQNFYNGAPSTSGSAYHSTDNWHGPAVASTHLPTTSSWSKVSLVSTSRAIKACNNANCDTISSSTTGGTITPSSFSYEGKAARLITLPELIRGCKSVNGNVSFTTTGALAACNFLYEKTKYAASSAPTYGPWFETPNSTGDDLTWWTSGYSEIVNTSATNNVTATTFGVRPVIEIPYYSILY